jgi:hypothetical protein
MRSRSGFQKGKCGLLLAVLALAELTATGRSAGAQVTEANIGSSAGSNLDTRGQVTVEGQAVPYRIRRLPVSSFPELPAAVASALAERGCLIPQTFEAKRPENVVHASLERAGSRDWAVLCSAQGEVSLLVFFASELASGKADTPAVLEKKPELACLERREAAGAMMGFAWGIDPASPKQVHDAQAGMAHRPPTLDHDCLAESQVEDKTIYHLYRNGSWETVATE